MTGENVAGAIFVTFVVSFAGGSFLIGWLDGMSLRVAQAQFNRCVDDGAPRDKCIEKYLLPTEQKP